MRFQIVLILLLLGMVVACAPPAAPSQSNVQPTIAPISAPSATVQSASNQPGAVACNATYAVPGGNEFRSDDPKKLEASSKPKLVEFFAYW